MKRYGIIFLITSLFVIVGIAYSNAADAKSNKTKTQNSSKTSAKENKWRDSFNVDKKNLGPKGSNTYFILEPGFKQFYKKDESTDTLTVLKETKIIDGVEVGIIEDREEKNGQVIEVTKDYFAFDKVTKNMYYFGEDVDYYKDGKVTGHGGTWISGINDAKFGLFIPGKIKVGDKFYQEIAPKVAMDRVEIKEIGLTIKTPAGTFENCIKVEETTPIEPDVKDYKWYAPGVGMIMDGDMPLIKIEKTSK